MKGRTSRGRSASPAPANDLVGALCEDRPPGKSLNLPISLPRRRTFWQEMSLPPRSENPLPVRTPDAPRRSRSGSRHQATMSTKNRLLDPRIAPQVRHDLDGEKKAGIEGLPAFVSVGEHEVTHVRDRELVPPQKPLVDLHLPLVRHLPGVIEADFLLGARGLVINDVETFLPDPHVIDRPVDHQVRRLVKMPDALEVHPPGIEIGMLERNCWHPEGHHERMWLALGAVEVEFTLEQHIDGEIQREGRTRRTRDAQPTIQVEAAWAFKKKFQLRPAQAERVARREEIAGSGHGYQTFFGRWSKCA
jgi:hypothetical protein